MRLLPLLDALNSNLASIGQLDKSNARSQQWISKTTSEFAKKCALSNFQSLI